MLALRCRGGVGELPERLRGSTASPVYSRAVWRPLHTVCPRRERQGAAGGV